MLGGFLPPWHLGWKGRRVGEEGGRGVEGWSSGEGKRKGKMVGEGK